MASCLPESVLPDVLCQFCQEYLYPPSQQCGLCDFILCPKCVLIVDLCPCCEAIFDPVICLDLNQILEDCLVQCQYPLCDFKSKGEEVREHMKDCRHKIRRRPNPYLTKIMQKQTAICKKTTVCPLRFYGELRCRWTGTTNEELMDHCYTCHEDLVHFGDDDLESDFNLFVDTSRTSDLWYIYPDGENELFLLLLKVDQHEKTVQFHGFYNGLAEDNHFEFLIYLHERETMRKLNLRAPCEVTRQYRNGLNRNSVTLSFDEVARCGIDDKLQFGMVIIQVR